jgi:hypothetical protein
MRDIIITPYEEDSRDFASMRSQSSCSLSSAGGPFDTSFSSISSLDSYDQCYTPSRRGSYCTIDVDGLSPTQASFRSHSSTSPVDAAMLYPMKTMMHNEKLEMYSQDHLYATPTAANRYNTNEGMMTFDYPQINAGYSQCDFGASFDSLPGMSFDALPELLYDNSTSPLHMTSSPPNFVIPSQTFISEPYRPITPMDASHASLGSPLADYSQQRSEGIKYFMSPRATPLQTPNSEFSARSFRSFERTPSSHSMESSVALQRVQSVSNSVPRIRKGRQIVPKIERVAAGAFYCDFPGCKSEKKGFKRHEHLKRHQRTHGEQKPFKCKFCNRNFFEDRTDNYRSHLERHTFKDKKGARTPYFPEAAAELAAWKRKRNLAERALDVPGEMFRIVTRRGKSRM